MSSEDVFAGQPAEVALPRLIEAFGQRIYHLGLRLCGSAADAEDLVQDTFLQAFRKWNQFEGRSKPSTWLYTIATRTCRRKQRRRAGQPSRIASLDDVMPFSENGIPTLPMDEDSPQDQHARAEARDRIKSAILDLPPAYRLPIVLKDIIELPVAEVASILDLKEATTKTRVHRARLLLRKSMVAPLPREPAPETIYRQSVCLDLLRTKLDAMDRDVPFPVDDSIVCERCQSVFASLDLTREACIEIAHDPLPSDLHQRLRDLIDLSAQESARR